MTDDPIVREVREVRQQIWDECGGDLEKYMDRLRLSEASDRERLVTPEDWAKRQSQSSSAAQPTT